MRVFATILIFLFSLSTIVGQVSFGCLTLDFETIPSGVSASGVVLSDQYRNTFGVTFSLEGGGNPVLAQIGPPIEAFLGAGGIADNPAAVVDVGDFFLTDDGALTNTAPPIILTFDVPIDTFSGCILDMDGNERFEIEAKDVDGNVVISEVLEANPNWPDGSLQCWGFNLPGCQGVIKTITYTGSRTDGRGFGLGMDHFSFCYTAAPLEAIIVPESCSALGSVQILDAPGYTFSFNGSPFSDQVLWENLAAGSYDIIIRDEEGCETEIPAFVVELAEPEVGGVSQEDTSCGEANGIIIIDAGDTQGPSYSLDGIDFQRSNRFENLVADSYNIFVQDSFGCVSIISATIESSSPPFVDSSFSTVDSCESGVGTIEVVGISEHLPIRYSLDNGQSNNDGRFGELSGGSYQVRLTDAIGCEAVFDLSVDITPGIMITGLNVITPECYVDNGSIEIEASGGVGELVSVLIDSINGPSGFENLFPGVYNLEVVDELGCVTRRRVEVPFPYCPIYIPNVISHQESITNDAFLIATHPLYNANVLNYRIYDRWGGLVYVTQNFNIHSGESYMWDGRINGRKAEQGIYTYLIEIEHPNRSIETFAGTVMLLR